MTGVMFTWQDSSIIDTRYKHMHHSWLHLQPELETRVREFLYHSLLLVENGYYYQKGALTQKHEIGLPAQRS